jgi:tRNA dimethylallyltransferase
MRAVGYRQLWAHLGGGCTFEAAVRAAQQATRNLAKRQLTWLRGDTSIRWLRSLEDQELVPMLRSVGSAVPG